MTPPEPLTPPARATVCAVVVTYHPDAAFVDRVRALAPEVGGIVVVDNASDPAEVAMLRGLAAKGDIALVESGENRGVGAALNTGVREATVRGFEWVILFDQDSRARPGLVENFARVCRELGPDLERLGMLGTNHVDVNSGEPYLRDVAGGSFVERKTVITSGTLLPIRVFDAIGPLREDLFIDSVDHEYSLRARKLGYLVLLAVAPLLEHAIGNRHIERPVLGFPVHTLNYPPFRWYYIVRNRVGVALEYAREEPAWAAARLAGLGVRLAVTLALEPDRREKARCMALGAWDLATGHEARRPREI